MVPCKFLGEEKQDCCLEIFRIFLEALERLVLTIPLYFHTATDLPYEKKRSIQIDSKMITKCKNTIMYYKSVIKYEKSTADFEIKEVIEKFILNYFFPNWKFFLKSQNELCQISRRREIEKQISANKAY